MDFIPAGDTPIFFKVLAKTIADTSTSAKAVTLALPKFTKVLTLKATPRDVAIPVATLAQLIPIVLAILVL
jgi:hypothetical protein